MAAITTRETAGTGATVKNAPLTNTEVDTNFININTDLSNAVYLASNQSVTGIKTFSNGINIGSQSYPTYSANIDFGSDVANTWRRIVTVSSPTGQYQSVGFKIEVTDPGANHATTTSADGIINHTYWVACVRTNDTVQDTPDACYVRGPGNLVRAVKTSVGNYEIQVQNLNQYRELYVEVYVYAHNGVHTVTYSAGGTAAAGTAQYNASVGTDTVWFDNLRAANSFQVTNQFAVTNTASAVNNITITGSTTGNRTSLSASGTDTNVGMRLSTKGTGDFLFQTGGGSEVNQFEIDHVASSVNWFTVQGAAAGAGPTLSAVGSDSNINILLSPKGAGSVGIATTPPSNTASELYVNGDLTITGSNRSLLGNLYYDTAWKYYANGYGWGLREDGAGKVQFLRAANNTSGANASATVSLVDVMTWDLVNNRIGIGTASPGSKLEVLGSFAATTKSFIIDHPTKPGKLLKHGSLEGPEFGVYVRGRLTDTNMIVLPEYWTKLVDPSTITVNLTPIGSHQDLYVENIVDNMVFVKNGNMFNKSINCFYTVFAERMDVDKLEVEVI